MKPTISPARPSDEPLMTVDDLALRWSVNRRWIYNRCYERKVPFVKVAGALRFDPAAIRALEAANATEAKAS